MAKISEESRLELAEAIKPYQSKIAVLLAQEKSVLSSLSSKERTFA